MNPLLLQNTEFTAGLAHDLRGPLGAISSAAEVLKQLSARMEVKNPQDAELMAQAQAVIARQTEQLTQRIEELLRAARAESGPFGSVRVIEEPAQAFEPSRLRRAAQEWRR